MISRTKIDKRIKRKTNPEIVETLLAMKKIKEWINIAKIISSSTRKYSSVNLDKIDKETKEGDTIVVPGKILGSGDVTKKLRIVALSFSEQAKNKLKAKKCEIVNLLEEVNKNPKAKGIKVIR